MSRLDEQLIEASKLPVKEGRIPAMERLLKLGANPNVINPETGKPLLWDLVLEPVSDGVIWYNESFTPHGVATLIKYGAKLDALNENGDTIMHYALSDKYGFRMLPELLNVDPRFASVQNAAGETVLMTCLKGEDYSSTNPDIVALLAVQDYSELKRKDPEAYYQQQEAIMKWLQADSSHIEAYARALAERRNNEPSTHLSENSAGTNLTEGSTDTNSSSSLSSQLGRTGHLLNPNTLPNSQNEEIYLLQNGQNSI